MGSDLPSFEDRFAVKEEDEILKLFLSFYFPTFFPNDSSDGTGIRS